MPPPTRVRYTMIALTTLVAVMLYLDRVCLGILSERVKPLLAADPADQARRFDYLTSAFFWTYALFQLPAGWLGDRYGPRAVLAAYLFLWSACTGLMGLADSFAALFALRLGCGMFEAGAYPLAAGVVRRWVPAAGRGFASGCVAVGGRLGGAIAPPLTVGLAYGAIDGWRRPLLVYGGLGMLLAVAFGLWFRNRPRDHPAVNDAEADLIGGGPHHARVGPPPVAGMVASGPLWCTSAVQFLANFAWVFLIGLFPAYMAEVHATDEKTRGWFQSAPLFAGIAGMLLGGWLTDRGVRRFGLRWGRAVPVAATRLLVGAAYLGCCGGADLLTVTVLLCVVALATDMGVAPAWAYAQDVGGRHVGAVLGWANMWGNLGAAVAPIVFAELRKGYADDKPAGWRAVFLLCAASQVLAAAAAVGMDARRPVAGAE